MPQLTDSDVFQFIKYSQRLVAGRTSSFLQLENCELEDLIGVTNICSDPEICMKIMTIRDSTSFEDNKTVEDDNCEDDNS